MSKSSRIRERNQVRAKALKGNALNLNNLQAEFLGKHASWNTKHNAYRSMAKLKGTRALQTLLGAAAELSFTAADPSARDDLLLEAVAWAKKYRRYATPERPHAEIDYALQTANLQLQTQLFIEHRHPSLPEKYEAQKFVTRALVAARSHHNTQRKATKESGQPFNVSGFVGSASEAIGFILLNRAAVELVRDESWTPVTALYSQARKDTGAKGSTGNWDASIVTDLANPFEPAHKIQFRWGGSAKVYDDDISVVSIRKTLQLPNEAHPYMGKYIREIGSSGQFDLSNEQLRARTLQLLDSIE